MGMSRAWATALRSEASLSGVQIFVKTDSVSERVDDFPYEYAENWNNLSCCKRPVYSDLRENRVACQWSGELVQQIREPYFQIEQGFPNGAVPAFVFLCFYLRRQCLECSDGLGKRGDDRSNVA